MPSATVTTKGQVTLPKKIRQRLGVRPGDRVAFREKEDGTIVVEPETIDLMDLYGVVRPRVRGVTVEDMNEAIREKAGKA
ncbi:MAG TPA: AbrB/MazE/SpoVT family DNA-binding domain-containing protein [Polyangiaceae bacterium]|nr:AbrB/MazE/SpoVT family DNA-binding domain-containing protein [Polyangiaceae bacterium]